MCFGCYLSQREKNVGNKRREDLFWSNPADIVSDALVLFFGGFNTK